MSLTTHRLRRAARLLPAAFLATTILAPPAAAQAPDAHVRLGDRFVGFVEDLSDVDVVRFDAVAGTALTATAKGKHGLLPSLELIALSDGMPIELGDALVGAGTPKARIKKLALPATGSYELRVGGELGSTGIVDVKLTGKPPKSAKSLVMVETPDGGGVALYTFDAVPGARLRAKIKATKGSGAIPAMPTLDVPDADGGPLPLDDHVTVATDTRLVLADVPLELLGEHALGVHNAGATGELEARLTVAFPKSKELHEEDGLPVLGKGPGAIAGSISVEDIPVAPESEPNDEVADARLLGAVVPGTVVRVVGSADDGGMPDTYDESDRDRFRVTFDGDQDVTFILLYELGEVPFGRNLDVFFHDTDGVLCARDGETCGPDALIESLVGMVTPLQPEVEELQVRPGDLPGGVLTLDVVVTSFRGASDYYLSIVSVPPAPAPPPPAATAAVTAFAPPWLDAHRAARLQEQTEGGVATATPTAGAAPGALRVRVPVADVDAIRHHPSRRAAHLARTGRPALATRAADGGALLELGPLTVVALHPVSNFPLGFDEVTLAEPGYVIAGLAAANWIVIAGSDLDGDGAICGIGEPCGFYPVFDDPAHVGVLPGLTTLGIDFQIVDFATALLAFAERE